MEAITGVNMIAETLLDIITTIDEKIPELTEESQDAILMILQTTLAKIQEIK